MGQTTKLNVKSSSGPRFENIFWVLHRTTVSLLDTKSWKWGTTVTLFDTPPENSQLNPECPNTGTRHIKSSYTIIYLRQKRLSYLSVGLKLPLIDRRIINRASTSLLICQVAHPDACCHIQQCTLRSNFATNFQRSRSLERLIVPCHAQERSAALKLATFGPSTPRF